MRGQSGHATLSGKSMHSNAKEDRSPGFGFLPDGQALVFQSRRGTTRLWSPARTMLVTQVVGSLSMEAVAGIGHALRRGIDSDGRYLGFNDWEDMIDYELDARIELTSQLLKVLPRVDGVHFLVHSKVVAFGIRAANLVLKTLKVHHTREDFEAALRDAVDRRSRPMTSRPPPWSG